MGNQYVILKAVHPTWCTTQLPGEVAELLGCSRKDLDGMKRPGRSIAFLARGQGVLRVVGFLRSADLLAKELAGNRVVAMAQLTEKLVFNIPASAEQYLGIKSYQKGTTGTRGTDDMVVWYMPEGEYYEYRELTRDGNEFTSLHSGSVPTVYLSKSIFSNLHKEPLSEPKEMQVAPVVKHSRIPGRTALVAR